MLFAYPEQAIILGNLAHLAGAHFMYPLQYMAWAEKMTRKHKMCTNPMLKQSLIKLSELTKLFGFHQWVKE